MSYAAIEYWSTRDLVNSRTVANVPLFRFFGYAGISLAGKLCWRSASAPIAARTFSNAKRAVPRSTPLISARNTSRISRRTTPTCPPQSPMHAPSPCPSA